MHGMRNKLNAAKAKSLPAGKHNDGAGLYLRKSGLRRGKWVFIYTINGGKREMGLGSYPEVSLAIAREQRDQWGDKLAQGNDPIELRAELRSKIREAASIKDPTFEDAVKNFLENIKAGLKHDGNAGRWRSPLDIHAMPKIGKRRVSTLTVQDMEDILQPLWKMNQPTAKKLYQRTRKVLDHASAENSSVDPSIVDRAVKKLPVVVHKTIGIKAIPWNKAPQLYARFTKQSSSHLALRFLMLTAVRANSCCGARFDEIEDDVWTVPAVRMKNTVSEAKDFAVLLPDECLRIIEICRMRTTGPYLFPGNKNKPLHGNALLKAMNELGEPTRPHGFRSAFKDWSEINYQGKTEHVEESLAHSVGNKTARAYKRSQLLEKRGPLLAQWADFLTGG